MALLSTHPVSVPHDLVGVPNGSVVPGVHVQITFPGKGPSWLHHNAARSWIALSAACKAATGFALTCTSVGDVMRTYQQQVNGFRPRYVNHFDPVTCNPDPKMNRTWNGVVYYLLKGRIPAAVPGTSNHGRGIAVDVAAFLNGAVDSVRSHPAVWAWLQAHVIEFGWSWVYSAQGVDDPHIQYWAGDVIPAAVLSFEAAQSLHQASPSPSPSNLPDVPRPTLRPGSAGLPVTNLQAHLHVLGLYVPEPDGGYGPVTQRAVKNLQLRMGFYGKYVDGIWGPMTHGKYIIWPQRAH